MHTRIISLPLLFVVGLSGTAHARPNIVTILLDDVRADNIQTLLAIDGAMPNLKRYLADGGVNFDNAFVTTSLCGPSRATFLTGQYGHNHGVVCNFDPLLGNAATLLKHDSTLPVWLKAAGYRTAHIGKYLNGYGSGSGNDTGPLNPAWIPPGWDEWLALVDPSTYLMYGYTINHNGRLVAYSPTPLPDETRYRSNYQTDVLARLAVGVVERAATQSQPKPLFMVITPLAAHAEHGPNAPWFQGCSHYMWSYAVRPAQRHIDSLAGAPFPGDPSFDEADLSDKPPHLRSLPNVDTACVQKQHQVRLESLRAVDDLIGTLVAELKRHGQWDNTVLMLTSDNGFFLGEHRLTQKILAYEPSIRVPLYLRAPGVAPSRSNAFVLNNDLAPTIAALAGARPNIDPDGRSLLPLLAGTIPATWRKRFLVEFRDPPETNPPFYAEPFRAVRTAPTEPVIANTIGIFWDYGATELYFLDNDPYQLESSNGPAFDIVRDALRSYAERLSTCAGASCRAIENE